MNTQSSFSNVEEYISALVDGETSSDETDAVLAACSDDPDLLARWRVYHLVGDVLRASAFASGRQLTLHQKIEARLEGESLPAMASYSAPRDLAFSMEQLVEPAKAVRTAANDSVFRWKVVAGVASLLAVSALAWTTLGTTASPSGSQLARMPTSDQVLVETVRGPVVRDAALEEMLAAHKQLGATAAQMPSGFLRNATFETQMPKNSGAK